MLQVALNGARQPGSHARLPLTPEDLAADAVECIAAGAVALHVHVRNSQRAESLLAQDVTATLEAIRGRLPTTPVGVSTGAWIVPDVATRLAVIGGWSLCPDYASVNFDEAGAADVARLLVRRGVGVEAGLASLAAAQALLDTDLAPVCLRVLLEPADATVPAAVVTIGAIEQLLDAANVRVARLLHGEGLTAWPLVELAHERRYATRIGLEDTLTLADGRAALSNAALVAEVGRRFDFAI